ncbi:MAG: DNA-binding protein [Breznakibacter sp.]
MKQIILSLFLLCSIFSANAQTEAKLYTYKQFGHKYVVSIQNRAEITEAITAFVTDQKIKAGSVIGLGAVDQASLRFFDPNTKKYVDKTYKEQMEVTNLTGNISQKDGKPYVHLHITLGRADYTSIAGHLLTAVIKGAGEFVIEDFGGEVNRSFDEETGLNLYKF